MRFALFPVVMLLAGCSMLPLAPSGSTGEITFIRPPSPGLKVVQVGDAYADSYRLCRDCGAPSRKTVALPPRPVRVVQAQITAPVPMAAAPAGPKEVSAQGFCERTVHFDSGSDVLDHAAEAVLTGLLDQLSHADAVLVQGYTDDQGSTDFNLRLGQRRAEAVAQWLTAHGVPASRLETWGLGECCFTESNTSADGRRANRRAVVSLTTTTRSSQ